MYKFHKNLLFGLPDLTILAKALGASIRSVHCQLKEVLHVYIYDIL